MGFILAARNIGTYLYTHTHTHIHTHTHTHTHAHTHYDVTDIAVGKPTWQRMCG
jgi:hypothetical protein